MAVLTKEITEEIMENLVALFDEGTEVTLEALSIRTTMPRNDIAESIKLLKEQRYLEPVETLVPTTKGLNLGRKMMRKHRLLERFLHDVLGFKKNQVHEEACRLEHALSDEAEAALCRYLEHPQNCPDGERFIPACSIDVDSCVDCKNGNCSEEHLLLIPLTDLDSGKKAKIKFIRGGKKIVQRLRDMGLVPNVIVVVRKRAPFGGPVELEVRSTKLAIGQGIAEKVFVEVC